MPTPSPDFLARQVRWAMGRGLPSQEAEDVVFRAWEQSSARYQSERGDFDNYMHAAVRNGCAYWWRRQARAHRAVEHLRLLPPPEDSQRGERAAAHQRALLDALDTDERQVFAAWALQKHLGKGKIQTPEVAASIGLTPRAFENAKRRLKERLHRLLSQFGWSPTDLLHGDDDVDRTG